MVNSCLCLNMRCVAKYLPGGKNMSIIDAIKNEVPVGTSFLVVLNLAGNSSVKQCDAP